MNDKKLTIMSSNPGRIGIWLAKIVNAAEAAGLDLDGFPEPIATRQTADGQEELHYSSLLPLTLTLTFTFFTSHPSSLPSRPSLPSNPAHLTPHI